MAAIPNPPNEPKQELRVLICTECGCQIDDVGCSFECNLDVPLYEKRDPAKMAYKVYVFDRMEPHGGNKQ